MSRDPDSADQPPAAWQYWPLLVLGVGLAGGGAVMLFLAGQTLGRLGC
ncbi:hypothetical protein [Synechococcus phage MinM1]|nr:hypothetical protein [Synechococcus phage MinM1]